MRGARSLDEGAANAAGKSDNRQTGWEYDNRYLQGSNNIPHATPEII